MLFIFSNELIGEDRQTCQNWSSSRYNSLCCAAHYFSLIIYDAIIVLNLYFASNT